MGHLPYEGYILLKTPSRLYRSALRVKRTTARKRTMRELAFGLFTFDRLKDALVGVLLRGKFPVNDGWRTVSYKMVGRLTIFYCLYLWRNINMNKELLKAAWIRAYRSFLQALVAQIPAGFVITPAMIQYFKVGYIYVVIAIVCNAALYGFASFVTCIVGGLPEVKLTETLYALDNDPSDEDEDFEEDEEVDKEV